MKTENKKDSLLYYNANHGCQFYGSCRSEMDFLKKLFLEEPDSSNPARIVDVKAAEGGLDCLEITTQGPSSKWRYRIYCEETS